MFNMAASFPLILNCLGARAVLQEVCQGEEEPEIRLRYYIISPKTLKEQGKLRLVWGQYNPNMPKKDFIELMRKAQKKGIIKVPSYSP